MALKYFSFFYLLKLYLPNSKVIKTNNYVTFYIHAYSNHLNCELIILYSYPNCKLYYSCKTFILPYEATNIFSQCIDTNIM